MRYEAGSVGFFAILLIPIDDWHITSFAVTGITNSSLHFTRRAKRQKYGEYREAWHLLKEMGLTIQACGGEEQECGEEETDSLDFATSSVLRVILASLNRYVRNPAPVYLPRLSVDREVAAPAVGDHEPDSETAPGFYVFAAVGLEGAIGLADRDRVAADLQGHVGGVFDADGLEAEVLVSGVAELVEKALDRLGTVGRIVMRSEVSAVGREERGGLVVVAGVECGDEILREIANQGLNVQGRTRIRQGIGIRAIHLLPPGGRQKSASASERDQRSSVHEHFSARICGKRKILRYAMAGYGGSGRSGWERKTASGKRGCCI